MSGLRTHFVPQIKFDFRFLGCEDGKVLALNTKTNRPQNLYGTESVAISLAANETGTGFLCGHDDGTIMRFYVGNMEDSPGIIVRHGASPLALAWANGHIIVAGWDKKVTFYDAKGHLLSLFDYSRDRSDIEYNIAASSANGRTVAVGSFNKLRLFTWNSRQKVWTEMATKEMKNLYSMTALAWKQDSSRLVVMLLCYTLLEKKTNVTLEKHLQVGGRLIMRRCFGVRSNYASHGVA